MERRPGDLNEVVRVVALVDEEPNLGNDVAEIGLVLAAADVKHPLQARQNMMPQPKKSFSSKKMILQDLHYKIKRVFSCEQNKKFVVDKF